MSELPAPKKCSSPLGKHWWSKNSTFCKRCGIEKPPPIPFMSRYKTYEGDRGSADEWREVFFARMGVGAARLLIKNDSSPRAILGVPLNCKDWLVIKAAYRRLVMFQHPDRGGSADVFKRTQAAYELLEEELL
jgi:hypothetical protein